LPDTARAVLPDLDPGSQGLLESLGAALTGRTGVVIPYEAWSPASLPDHLRVTIRVVDEAGAVLDEGKDLAALQSALAPAVQASISHASRSLERVGLVVVEESHGEHVVRGWPALVARGDSVDLRVLVGGAEQDLEMRSGVRALMRRDIAVPLRYVVGVLDMREKLALAHTPHGSVPALVDDAFAACLDSAVVRAGGVPWDRRAYDAIVADARARIGDDLLRTVRQSTQILELANESRLRLASVTSPKLLEMRMDITAQLDAIVADGFICDAGAERLPDLLRYLRAVARRLETAPEDPARDQSRQRQIEAVRGEERATLAILSPAEAQSNAAREIRWLIEELRVNLFAQSLGTRAPISDKRILKALDALPPIRR
jgi:ATP-dependent helicase HrpA